MNGEPDSPANMLINDLTQVLCLFDVRISSFVQNSPSLLRIKDRGRKLAELHSNVQINKNNRKLLNRMFARVNQKVRGMEGSVNSRNVQQFHKIKAQVLNASKQVSIGNVILDLLGIPTFLNSPSSIAGKEKSQRLSPHFKYGAYHDKYMTLTPFPENNSLPVVQQDFEVYSILDLMCQDLPKKMKRAQQERQRNSKFLYNEILDRNYEIGVEIKRYEAEFRRYKGSKKLKKVNMKRMVKAHSYQQKLTNFMEKPIPKTLQKNSIEKQKIENYKIPHKMNLLNRRANTNIDVDRSAGKQKWDKMKSNSTSSLIDENKSISNIKYEGLAKFLNKVGSGSVLHMSKVNFLADPNEEKPMASPLKELVGAASRKGKMRFKEQFYHKKYRLQSIISKASTSNIKESPSLPPVQSNYLIICKGLQN